MRVLGKLSLSLIAAGGLLVVGEAAIRFSGAAPAFLNLQPKIWQVPTDHVESALAKAGPKKHDGFRILALGESTVLGWPLPPEFSFASLLAPILNELPVSRRVEVVNLAHQAIHAEDIAGILEASDPLEPDLYLVVAGQNEFANRLFWKPPRPLAHRLFASSHLLRWLFVPGRETRVPESFLQARAEELVAMDDARTGRPVLDNLPVAEFERDVYRERYGRAITRMAVAAKARGKPIVFGEPVVNLKEYSPYFPTARSREAFEAGRAALARGEVAGARRFFEEALDADGGPLRMPGPLLAELRRVCTEQGVPLVPLRSYIEGVSRDGIPGHEAILDNLHPNVMGHRTIALGTARFLVERGLVSLPASPPQAVDAWAKIAAELERIDLLPEKKKDVAMKSAFYLGAQYFAAGNIAASEQRLREAFDQYGARDAVTQQLLAKIYRSQGREDEIKRLEQRLTAEKRNDGK